MDFHYIVRGNINNVDVLGMESIWQSRMVVADVGKNCTVKYEEVTCLQYPGMDDKFVVIAEDTINCVVVHHNR